VRAVVLGKERVKAAAVAEHPQRFLRLPRRRWQHEDQDAEVFLDVRRRESLGSFQHERPRARCIVQRLTVGMVAVLECRQRLVVDLRGRYDPQHKPAVSLAEVRVDQFHAFGRQQGLAAAGGNFQAKGRQRLTHAIAPRVVAPALDAFPGLFRPVDAPVRIDGARLRILGAQFRQRFQVEAHRLQRLLLVLLELDHFPCALW
jgi:hypothetical protein